MFTGAGISAESGLKTFRGDGGLWEGHRVEDVATPEAWARNPALVLEFYNQRRQQVRAAQPNAAHKALVDLEQGYDVRIITQNVDDLHERAGSQNVLHLHGEVLYARSTQDPGYTRHLGAADIATDGWLHAKLALVAAMTGFHHACERWRRYFEQDANRRTGRFYRIANEAPTLAFIAVVVLVIWRPF